MSQLGDWLINVGESTGGLIPTFSTSDKSVTESLTKALAVNQFLKSQSLYQAAELETVSLPSETPAEEVQVTGENTPFSLHWEPHCPADKVVTAKTRPHAPELRGGVKSVVFYSQKTSEHLTNTPDKLILNTTRKLLEFGNMEPDWDSYGAQPIALKAVQKAEKLLTKIATQFYATKGELICPFDIAPRSDGGVQLEWRSAKGSLEVEIQPSQGYGYLLILGQGESRTFEEGDDATAPDILALLSRIIG